MVYDCIIIGGGIIGLSVGMTLSQRYSDAIIGILEKEDRLAAHQAQIVGGDGFRKTNGPQPVVSANRRLSCFPGNEARDARHVSIDVLDRLTLMNPARDTIEYVVCVVNRRAAPLPREIVDQLFPDAVVSNGSALPVGVELAQQQIECALRQT